MELLEVKKRYEWISTSRIGRVETYLAEDEQNNTYFESGRVVPTSDIQNLLRKWQLRAILAQLLFKSV